MRFFTMAWWCGLQRGDASDPSVPYVAHLAAIRDRLPPDLLTTEESVSLHDARLRDLRFAERRLVLGFDDHDADERLTLTYLDVERFGSTSDPEVSLGGPGGYGDLGYSEVDVLPIGVFEHRLLFSTGIEFSVVFRGFQLHRSNCVASGPATPPDSCAGA